jgi:hypothetical protein
MPLLESGSLTSHPDDAVALCIPFDRRERTQMKFHTLLTIPLGCLLLASPVLAEDDDLNSQLMQATFKLGNDKSVATCFLLSRPSPDDAGKSQVILVTAGHVFENMGGDEATLFMRKKESEGAYKKEPITLQIRKEGKPLWVKHPEADVAAMYVEAAIPPEIPALSIDLLATDDTLKKYAIHPGDALRCLGYPHRFEVNEAGFPVLRMGTIASFPLVPTKVTRTFLFSYNTFEGDSGGPVYIAESNRECGGNKEPGEVRLILGLVSGQHFIDEDTRTAYETRRVRHQLGLAIVVHAVFIRETIALLPPKP